MKKILLLIVPLFLFVSCCRVEERRLRSYIAGFYEVADFDAKVAGSGYVALFWTCRPIAGEHYTLPVDMSTFLSRGERATRFNDLVTRHNDLGYNRVVTFIVHPIGRDYSATSAVSINVVTNVDFDEQHPAGSSLNDVILLLSASPKRFIQSGYKETYNWHQKPPECPTNRVLHWFPPTPYRPNHHPVKGYLSELKAEDLLLLGLGGGFFGPSRDTMEIEGHPGLFIYSVSDFFGYLFFSRFPDNLHQTYNMTITIHLEDGREFSQTVEMSFLPSSDPGLPFDPDFPFLH